LVYGQKREMSVSHESRSMTCAIASSKITSPPTGFPSGKNVWLYQMK